VNYKLIMNYSYCETS